MTFLNTLFKNQLGAMFGMDARIALVIASVLAGAGGVTLMSKLERNRVQAAEHSVIIIADAIKNYYETIEPFDELPDVLKYVFDEGLVESNSLETDPWNNDWKYFKTSDVISISGVDVTAHYGIVYSAGKDGIDDSLHVSSIGEWQEWEARNDDIGFKFNTIEIEKKRLKVSSEQLRQIIAKLENYSSSRYIDSQKQCEQQDPPEFCSRDTKYTDFNYYPQSTEDNSGAVYYDQVLGDYNSSPYSSGIQSSIEELLRVLNLPTNFSTGPWGGVLNYDSNVYKRTTSPFEASVWYE